MICFITYIKGVHFGTSGSSYKKQQQHSQPHDRKNSEESSTVGSGSWSEGGGSEHTINGQRFAFEVRIIY